MVRIGVISVASFALSAVLAAPAASSDVWIESAERAAIKPAFRPLPPGAVTPRGWLRDQALAAARGITGHLDEYSAAIGEAWKGYAFHAKGARPDGTGWPLEQSSYWLDGAVRLAWILQDPALMAKVSKRLKRVIDGVLAGGETFIYWLPQSVVDVAFNSWAHSHMGRALVAYYQATQDPRALQALVRVYSSFPLPDMRTAFDIVSGANNIDAMADTYLLSGDARIAGRLIEYSRRASYRQLRSLWLAGKLEAGHTVIFYENVRLPAILSTWTGDRDDLRASLEALAWADRNHLLPIGLASGEEHLAGIGATRNVETCNVAASMWTFLSLLRATGDGNWSDRIERVFLNAGPAPVARDFKTMCYYQSPNRYSASNPADEPRNPGQGAYRFTPIGHPVLCCVGNVNRIIPNYVMHMWMATLDGGLAATLYGPSAVETRAAGVPVKLVEDTIYPFEDSIRLRINPAVAAEFPLNLRIPAWCAAPQLKINGTAVKIGQHSGGFVRLCRRWRPGDTVTLRFPMTVTLSRGLETPYPRTPYYEDPGNRRIASQTAAGSPWASVSYGPLLFALPIADDTPNQEAAGVRFGYALDLDAARAARQTKVLRSSMPAEWKWQLESPIRLSVPVREFDWKPTELQPLPPAPVAGLKRTRVTLVPYGCTKFRVSMFPVTAKTWSGFTGNPGPDQPAGRARGALDSPPVAGGMRPVQWVGKQAWNAFTGLASGDP